MGLKALLAVTAAGTALMFVVTAVLAATLTVTVTGANSTGAVTASAGTTTVKDTRNGDTFTCTSSTVSGTVKDRTTTSTPPVKIGPITTTFKSCTGPGGLAWTLTLSGTLATTQATSGGVTAGGETSLSFTLSGTACMVTASGSLPGTFTNPSGTSKAVLALSPTAPNPFGFKLTVKSANCLGIYKAGDVFQITAKYTVTDPATLTVDAH